MSVFKFNLSHYTRVISALLRSAADPLSCDSRGATALHFAAARGHLEACRMLVEVIGEIQEDEAQAGEPVVCSHTQPPPPVTFTLVYWYTKYPGGGPR